MDKNYTKKNQKRILLILCLRKEGEEEGRMRGMMMMT